MTQPYKFLTLTSESLTILNELSVTLLDLTLSTDVQYIIFPGNKFLICGFFANCERIQFVISLLQNGLNKKQTPKWHSAINLTFLIVSNEMGKKTQWMIHL